MPPDIFENIAESVSDAVAVTDSVGTIVYVNRAFGRLTGYDTAACRGRPIGLLGDAVARLTEPQAEPPAELLETVVRPRSGPPVRVELRIRPLDGTDGSAGHRLWLLRDLSERTEIAAALRVSEERFRDFAEIASDWLWELGPDLRFTYVTDRLGGDPRRLIGTLPGELVTDPEEQTHWRDHRALLSQRLPFRNFVNRRKLVDGSYQYISASGKPMRDGDGSFLGYRGTATDITAQREAERRISEANQKLQECIESLAEAFALFGPDNRLMLCNEQFRGLNPAIRDVMQPGARFIDIAKASLRLRTIPEAIGHERTWLREWTAQLRLPRSMVHRKLNDRWFQLNLQRLSDGCLVMIGADITEVILREDRLREARDAAERANRMKSEFLATMSHELRTPLNAILGFSEIMRDGLFGTLGPARYRDYVADIHQSAQHLLDIISDVLDMSKLEAGQMTAQHERVDVAMTITHCVRLMRERAASRQLRLKAGSTDRLPALLADQRMVKQIVLNLLSNAIKFTEPHGEIRVECAVDAEGLAISVRDTGIGIAPHDIPRALIPFQQIEDPLSRRFDGTGLGLPIVKAIMDLHGGSVALTSTPGIGTRVTVRFPAGRVLPEGAAAPAEQPAEATAPATATPPRARRSSRRGARVTGGC
ncbi:MAG: PAS domain-containing sensor histidine kinase [Pseudomonadota bacterium]